MNFAEKLKELRTKSGLSQEEVAKAAGVSARAYRSYETQGIYPRNREVYRKLADTFGCDLNYLLTENEAFVADAAEQYGLRGQKQAKELVSQVSGLFAGGSLADEDLDMMMKSIQDAYWIAKEKNKKYGRKQETPQE